MSLKTCYEKWLVSLNYACVMILPPIFPLVLDFNSEKNQKCDYLKNSLLYTARDTSLE